MLEIKKLPTKFAPAERAQFEEIKRQAKYFEANAPLSDMLDNVPDLVVVLNKERQIIYANKSLMNFLGIEDVQLAYCLRPGEAFDCSHGSEESGGCGTSEFCKTCGAVKAILNGQRGKSDIQECRILKKETGEALDLRVWTRPVVVEGEVFTIFTVSDISNEKRRHALERIFFHDVLNTASGLKGIVEILQDANQNESVQYKALLTGIADKLIDEIKAQRELNMAENNELKTDLSVIDSQKFMEEVIEFYRHHPVSDNRSLILKADSPAIDFVSDRTILFRVIGNMIKNALEASLPEGVVTALCCLNNDKVEFHIHNQTFIKRDTQLQIFKRSFSTKAADRGLGTYCMKLLSERYLKGSVRFTSSEVEGTTFIGSYPLYPPLP